MTQKVRGITKKGLLKCEKIHLQKQRQQFEALLDLGVWLQIKIVTFHSLHVGLLLLLRGLDVDGEGEVVLADLELDGVADLEKLLLVLQTGDGEFELSKH